jgi:hypothetical protein
MNLDSESRIRKQIQNPNSGSESKSEFRNQIQNPDSESESKIRVQNPDSDSNSIALEKMKSRKIIGQQMIYTVEEERNLYFQQLNEEW